MTTPISRRQFLRGKLKAQHSLVRPPRATEGHAFLESCTRCGDCLKVCEEGIIQSDSGYPYLDFSISGCNFCDDCTQVCKSGALSASDNRLTLKYSVVINEPQCLASQGVICQVCKEQCDADAIFISLTTGAVPAPELNQDQCTACGYCVAACPGKALSIQPYSKPYPQEDTQCMSQA